MEDGDNVVGGPWPRKRLSEAELIARQKEIDYRRGRFDGVDMGTWLQATEG